MSREGRTRWGLWQTFVIGRQDNPMMKRIRMIQSPLGGIYLHLIYREDMDPVVHDHPWNFLRIVLRGGYVEDWTSDPGWGPLGSREIRRWRPRWFPTSHAHRITHVAPGTVSLVVVGRKARVWGFWEPNPEASSYGDRVAATLGASITLHPARTWVDYRDALGLRPTEGVTE